MKSRYIDRNTGVQTDKEKKEREKLKRTSYTGRQIDRRTGMQKKDMKE